MFNGGHLLLASIIAAVIGISSILLGPTMAGPTAEMRIEPSGGTIAVGEDFKVDIIVESREPVNVFKGLLSFDPTVLAITSIDYNTSAADLWAERPWFSNGEGTLNFIGGTTRPGGFTGTEKLISITFTAKASGKAKMVMTDVRILKHDGLGTDSVLATPLDSIFTIAPEELEKSTKLETSLIGPTVVVTDTPPTTDLNGDGKQTILDVSIFMSDLASQNRQSDFNGDGKVDLADLSILNR
ncbi:MAG: dockerin type I domain-containing protein [Patescibacteria group bacterium]